MSGEEEDVRIGVIGSGDVGRTLAEGLKKHGYEVRIATRTPGKLADFVKSSGIPAGWFPEVAAWAEGIVLAVKGSAAEAAIREAGPANVAGKLVIDPTNPISDEPPEDGVLRFFTSPNATAWRTLSRCCDPNIWSSGHLVIWSSGHFNFSISQSNDQMTR